jgi:hypothetical protein
MWLKFNIQIYIKEMQISIVDRDTDYVLRVSIVFLRQMAR